MRIIAAIMAFIVFSCGSCTNYLDQTSSLVFKENPITKSDVRFQARIRDKEKGYWQLHGTKDFRVHISLADSIPLSKGSSRFYVADYELQGDTLKMSFTRNHFPPTLEYVLLRKDSLYLKTKKYDELIVVSVTYFK